MAFRKGHCLSPGLFKFYLNDLCTDLSVNAGFQLFKFADDCSILCCSSSAEICLEMMNQSVNSLKLWCSKWRMIVNCSKNKTEFICFNTPRSSSTLIPSQIKFGNKTIQNVNETKVLGVIFDNRLEFLSHSEMIYYRLCSRWVNICKYANKNWDLCQRTLVFLVKTILLPCIFYGGIIWMGEKTKKKINKLLYRINKTAIGAVFNVDSRLSELILGTPPIEILNNMNVIKHFLKIIMVAKQHPEDNSNDCLLAH